MLRARSPPCGCSVLPPSPSLLSSPPSLLFLQLLISLFNFTSTPKEDKLKFAFEMFSHGEDPNSQTIVKAELVRILMANHMALNEKEVMKKCETVLAQADADGDGVVTLDEFFLVAKRFPNILFASALYGTSTTAAK